MIKSQVILNLLFTRDLILKSVIDAYGAKVDIYALPHIMLKPTLKAQSSKLLTTFTFSPTACNVCLKP